MKRTGSFSDQYKHPNWQKKRLEIFERDGFLCQHCEIGDRTLQVHHRKYEKSKHIWECSDDCYVTLCESCHSKATALVDRCRWNTGDLLSVDIMETMLDGADSPDSILVADIVAALIRRPDMVQPVFSLLNALHKQDQQKLEKK